MNPVEVGPVPTVERTLSALDLFLIWAGANIVATTLAVGSCLDASLGATQALWVIVAGCVSGTALIAKDPYVAFAKLSALFEPRPQRAPGVHPSAVIDDSAQVDASAHVGPHVSIGARSRIEAGAVLGAGCVIGEDCVVGAASELVARVTLVARVRMGQRVVVHPGAVIGAAGFGLAMEAGRWLNVPQLGGVVIGDD